MDKYLKRYEVLLSCLTLFFGFYSVGDLFRLRLLYLNTTNLSLKEKEYSTLRLFRVTITVLRENIPQFIIQSYHITASQSENFSKTVVISLCFSVVSIILSVIVRTNESLSRMKMVSSFKYTETMWASDAIKREHEIDNNRMKKIDKKQKNKTDKKTKADARSSSGTGGTIGASTASVTSGSDSNNGGIIIVLILMAEKLDVEIYLQQEIAHYMEGAVKFKLSEDLDRYETLISSEVYFIQWYSSTIIESLS